MVIYGIAVVKNEEDIIESFVRYHTAFLDGLVILDNKSLDATAHLLSNLKLEINDLHVIEDADASYVQEEKTTKLLSHVFRTYQPDMIAVLDADEFLISENRAGNPRTNLDKFDVHKVYYLPMKVYFPDSTDDTTESFIPKQIKKLRIKKNDTFYKIVIGRKAFEDFELTVARGNHDVIPSSMSLQPDRIKVDSLFIAHYPVRSIWQWQLKVLIAWFNLLLRTDFDKSYCSHTWRAVDNIKKRGLYNNKDLTSALSWYNAARDGAQNEFMEAPLNFVWCAEKISISHANSVMDEKSFLRHFLSHIEEAIRFQVVTWTNKADAAGNTAIEYALQRENEILRDRLRTLEASISWKITVPLRAIGNRIRSLIM